MAVNEQYRIRFTMKADGEDAEVIVYSEISSERFWGDETTQGDFDKALKAARKEGAKNLNIRINSPGGEVYAAVAMRSMVINSGFDKVRVMIEGLCASAATLFVTIPGAEVVIAEGSEFMIHNPMTIAWGNSEEIEKTVEHLRKMEEQFCDMYAARTGKETARIKEWMDATTWFTAKEAVENGFCDKLLQSGKVAACVTQRDMALMKAIYRDVPDFQIAANDRGNTTKTTGTLKDVSNGSPVAGAPTENMPKEEKKTMELNESTTMEQLREANPALFAQVQQDAVNAERERLAEIDALTMPGCEEMAEQAKADGTSAMDFHKKIVEARKKQGEEFIAARQKETQPAKDIAGGAPDGNGRTEQQEIDDYAKEMAKYATLYNPGTEDGMY
jgi:ATP-dependent protease ClpP protease subunit